MTLSGVCGSEPEDSRDATDDRCLDTAAPTRLDVLRGQCLLKQQNGDDYPAAALKRPQDADVLIKG